MIERLTNRNESGIAYAKIPANPSNMIDVGECYTGRIIDHLAAYEDSGLSPQEVQKMARAKVEGRLVELPCKVGDPIYWFWTDGEGNPEGDVEEETVLYFYIDKDGLGIATKFYDGHIGHYVKDGELVDGVRKMFLSREAAEKALGGKDDV